MNQRSGVGTDARVSAAEHVRCRQFDNDLVMVDLQGGEYFALNAVGARMWDLLTSGKTLAEVAEALAAEYEAGQDEIFSDCKKLADELLTRGLLVLKAP
jgi:hypothetical protein